MKKSSIKPPQETEKSKPQNEKPLQSLVLDSAQRKRLQQQMQQVIKGYRVWPNECLLCAGEGGKPGVQQVLWGACLKKWIGKAAVGAVSSAGTDKSGSTQKDSWNWWCKAGLVSWGLRCSRVRQLPWPRLNSDSNLSKSCFHQLLHYFLLLMLLVLFFPPPTAQDCVGIQFEHRKSSIDEKLYLEKFFSGSVQGWRQFLKTWNLEPAQSQENKVHWFCVNLVGVLHTFYRVTFWSVAARRGHRPLSHKHKNGSCVRPVNDLVILQLQSEKRGVCEHVGSSDS